ncbi:hypothetical protein GCM10011415_39060 [Salipiger pallidus]|uniref:Uncharacterized protein n=1 Tax=Salipiger pallidus TaxID=1775170 RepID=A0A8J2ZNH2_9RHOB|nr:hypothetical protein GCM10011415_39060 [Salipiger pallidus]
MNYNSTLRLTLFMVRRASEPIIGLPSECTRPYDGGYSDLGPYPALNSPKTLGDAKDCAVPGRCSTGPQIPGRNERSDWTLRIGTSHRSNSRQLFDLCSGLRGHGSLATAQTAISASAAPGTRVPPKVRAATMGGVALVT